MRVIFLDNRDSFVYNLVDLTAREAAVQVFRNTTPTSTLLKALVPTEAERAAGERPLLILSPGPGHPRGAGNMMEILEVALRENIPTLGICLGFQAMVEACGGVVGPVGATHGRTDRIELTEAGIEDPAFSSIAEKTKKRKPQQLLEVPSVRLINSLALERRGRFAICCFMMSKVKI